VEHPHVLDLVVRGDRARRRPRVRLRSEDGEGQQGDEEGAHLRMKPAAPAGRNRDRTLNLTQLSVRTRCYANTGGEQ
jgi:hypothetical protein